MPQQIIREHPEPGASGHVGCGSCQVYEVQLDSSMTHADDQLAGAQPHSLAVPMQLVHPPPWLVRRPAATMVQSSLPPAPHAPHLQPGTRDSRVAAGIVG